MAENTETVAKRSVALIFQAGTEEAEKAVSECGEKSFSLDMAMCFIRTVKCLLTWDSDIMDETDTFIKGVESRCSSASKAAHNLEQTLHLRIVCADCDLLRALICFARQALTYYVKGGILLRSASKTYTSVQADLPKLAPNQGSVEAASSMGFGVVNVAVSLLPEKVMGLMKMVGFHGDRAVGLRSLDVVLHSSDMRTPFAMLMMLAYHVVVRPVLGIDVEDGLTDSIEKATAILDMSQTVMPDAPLFKYFRGRVAFLDRDLEKALECFTGATGCASAQPELQQLCKYEMAFIKILHLQWKELSDILIDLCSNSPWSPGVYTFFSALGLAAIGEDDESHKRLLSVPDLIKQKSATFEKLVLHKVTAFTQKRLTVHSARVELLVMTYMSNYLGWCSPAQCRVIIDHLQANESSIKSDPYFTAGSALVCGAAYVQLKEGDTAEPWLRKVLSHAKDCVDSGDSHIPAHATLQLASVYEQRGEIAKARNALEKAKSLYTGYELESQVQLKVKARLENLPK